MAWMSSTHASDGQLFFESFREGLRERGRTEGRDLLLEQRWAEDRRDRGDALVQDVLAWRPDVIVTQGWIAQPVQRATTSVPTVFGYSGDPVQAGFVASLGRPGGNMTGVTFMTFDLVGKRVEMLTEMLPRAKRIAVIANSQHPGDATERRVSHAAADARGLALSYFEVRNREELVAALGAVEATRSDALLCFPTANIINDRALIADWSIRRGMPTMSGWAQFAEGGNLLSYGPSLSAAFRSLAGPVERILKGTRPADIPVEQPTRFELVINMKAARALRLKLPQAFLLRADRLIE